MLDAEVLHGQERPTSRGGALSQFLMLLFAGDSVAIAVEVCRIARLATENRSHAGLAGLCAVRVRGTAKSGRTGTGAGGDPRQRAARCDGRRRDRHQRSGKTGNKGATKFENLKPGKYSISVKTGEKYEALEAMEVEVAKGSQNKTVTVKTKPAEEETPAE